MDCLFCKIVRKEIPAVLISENEKTLAFLDIYPLTKGHTLVIPKAHAENLFDISEDDLLAVAATAKAVAAKIKDSLRADGIKLVQSNGKIAGQVIPHFHLHIIPFYEGGTVAGNWEPQHPAQADTRELQAIARFIIDN